MSPWFWVLIGILICPTIVASIILVMYAILCGVLWLNWKHRQIRMRAEWTQVNPYWRESFDKGVKWAQEQEQTKDD